MGLIYKFLLQCVFVGISCVAVCESAHHGTEKELSPYSQKTLNARPFANYNDNKCFYLL